MVRGMVREVVREEVALLSLYIRITVKLLFIRGFKNESVKVEVKN